MWIGFLTVVQDLGRFKPLIKVFDRTKAVTQYLLENSLKKYKKRKEKHKQNSFSEYLLRFGVLRVFFSVCLFVYGPFCHGVLKGTRAHHFRLESTYVKIEFKHESH